MKYLYQLLSVACRALLLIPSILFYFDAIEQERMKVLMFTGTLIWFAGAIPWLGKKKKEV